MFYFDIDKQRVTVRYKNFGPKVPAATIKKSQYRPEYLLFSIYGGKTLYAIHRDNLLKVNRLIPVPDVYNPGNVKFVLRNNGKEVVLAESHTLQTENKITNGENTYESVYGLGILRYKNGKLRDTITESKGLGSNLLSGFLKKRNGDIYYGTFGGGISVLKANNVRLSYQLENLKVRAINQQDNKYYVLSNGYLYILDHNELLAKTFLKRDALTMLVDGEDFYLGSFSGLDHYKLRNNVLHHISHFPLGSGFQKSRKTTEKSFFLPTTAEFLFRKEALSERRYFNDFCCLREVSQNEVYCSYHL